MQIVTTVLKLAPMAVVIGLGLWTAVRGSGGLYAQPAHDAGDRAGRHGGFDDRAVRDARHRVRRSAGGPGARPGRTIPRATIVGTLITALVYVGVPSIALLIVPQATLAGSSAPFVDVLDRLSASAAARWLAFSS